MLFTDSGIMTFLLTVANLQIHYELNGELCEF